MVNQLVASMIFFPTTEYGVLPSQLHLSPEDAYPVTSDGVKLHGWYFERVGASSCLLAFHGNGCNVSALLPIASLWLRFGFSVFLIDYRSYGQSEGTIKSGKDLFKDAQASVDWLLSVKKFTLSNIILYGQSIGSAPALELAIKEPYQALILEAPFTSLKEMSKLHYGMRLDLFLKDFPYHNEEKIMKAKCPVLIMHGTEDETCPFWMGQKLFDLAPEPKKLLAIDGVGHNDLFDINAHQQLAKYAKTYSVA